jgi:hypothetical protein
MGVPYAPLPHKALEPPGQDSISEVELPTAIPDYRLLFSATVFWRPIPDQGKPSHANLGALAKRAVIERAAAMARDIAPSSATVTKHQLAALIGEPQRDPTGRLQAWATEVTLEIRSGDAKRLCTLSDLRKQSQVWEQEREHERNVRAYLGEDVLTTTGRALVWWLARNEDDIEGAATRISNLARLSAVSQDQDDPGAIGPHLVAALPSTDSANDRALTATRDLLHQLFPDSDDQRQMFAWDLARAAEAYGHNEYGGRLRHMFEVQDVDEGPPGPDDEESATA